MKQIALILTFILFAKIACAQPQTFTSDYIFEQAYDGNGNPISEQGINKVSIMVVTTYFMGMTQTSCAYAFYTYGMLGQYVDFTGYRMQNGWHIYNYGYNMILISSDLQKVRLKMTYMGGNYHQYRKKRRNEETEDAPIW